MHSLLWGGTSGGSGALMLVMWDTQQPQYHCITDIGLRPMWTNIKLSQNILMVSISSLSPTLKWSEMTEHLRRDDDNPSEDLRQSQPSDSIQN